MLHQNISVDINDNHFLLQYVARPSVPVKEKEKATTGVGSKRNPVRQSHVITSNGNSRDKEERHDNGQGGEQLHSNKHQAHQMEKSETVSKATGASTAQGVSKYQSTNWGQASFCPPKSILSFVCLLSAKEGPDCKSFLQIRFSLTSTLPWCGVSALESKCSLHQLFFLSIY